MNEQSYKAKQGKQRARDGKRDFKKDSALLLKENK
ncbi:hypothetical protein N478_17240 [Pseudoalteromonas luteoviolacea S4060-1]|uniref:Uncharacterized protein n=1 Tax=Pseudoalteromonas luteoviolacea S4060-1 TaxID=1365257 RepID=A0A167NDE8_9GAMM|nr:hypothetical protein N478_17240 [Pseudoalteromonas luteoviolacea S4060-1]